MVAETMGEKESSVSSCKWSMEEREKILATGTLEQKKEAFRDDEELMRETTKFVSEVIDTAATEACKRKTRTETDDANEGSKLNAIDSIAGWNNRARGFCNRILNAVCPCFTNNDLICPEKLDLTNTMSNTKDETVSDIQTHIHKIIRLDTVPVSLHEILLIACHVPELRYCVYPAAAVRLIDRIMKNCASTRPAE